MAQAQSEFLIQIQLVDGQAQAKLNGVTVSLSQIDKELKNIKTSSTGTSAGLNKISTAAKGTTKANQDLISSSGLAGATLVETGRFISDLPFGITAVTNNLSQLSTLFITLASKTEESGGAFKALGKQLMGPLGFVLIFQVLISLLQVYQKEIMGFIKGTEEANKATKDMTKSVDTLTDSLKENNKELKKREDAEEILDELREQALKNDRMHDNYYKNTGKRQLEDRIEKLKELGIEIDQNRILEDGYIESLKEQVKTAAEISQELEDRRIQLEVDRIIGRSTPLELAQRELDLFIDTQKELNVKIEDYVKGEEFKKLLAKRDRAILDAREVQALDVSIRARGYVEQQITGELLLTKATEQNTNARIKLSDKEQRLKTRHLKMVSRELGKTQDAFAEGTAANKALGVANATIDTYAAADAIMNPVKGGGLPFPLNIIAAAAVVAAGLANVKNILSVKVPGGKGGGISAPPAPPLSMQAPDFNVVGATAQSQLAQTIAGAESKPVRAFVVGKDVTTQQELDRNRRRTSALG